MAGVYVATPCYAEVEVQTHLFRKRERNSNSETDWQIPQKISTPRGSYNKQYAIARGIYQITLVILDTSWLIYLYKYLLSVCYAQDPQNIQMRKIWFLSSYS